MQNTYLSEVWGVQEFLTIVQSLIISRKQAKTTSVCTPGASLARNSLMTDLGLIFLTSKKARHRYHTDSSVGLMIYRKTRARCPNIFPTSSCRTPAARHQWQVVHLTVAAASVASRW